MNYKQYLYSQDWKTLRQKAIERDGGKCSFCNRKFREVHHVKYPKRFKEDHIDNLLCVCDKCHRRLHGIKDDDKELMNAIDNRISRHKNIILEPENGIMNFDEIDNEGYIGLDFSGGVDFGYITRGRESMDACRKNNFDMVMDLFEDYLPNMTFDKFRLFSWKGGMCWSDDDEWIHETMHSETTNDLTFQTTHDIIFWIIKNKWGKK